METKDAMKIISDGWVRRLKGFRVHLQKRVNSEWITDYFPDKEQKPFSSETMAWELARRFAEATKSDSPEVDDGEIVNIYVVDDLDNPVKYYGTNKHMILNPKDIEES